MSEQTGTRTLTTRSTSTARRHEHHVAAHCLCGHLSALLLVLYGLTVGRRSSRWACSTRSSRWPLACTKATLVVLFFMHVKYSTKLTKLTVGRALYVPGADRHDAGRLHQPGLGKKSSFS
jgi:caa(3)-type oxidase subunit IV